MKRLANSFVLLCMFLAQPCFGQTLPNAQATQNKPSQKQAVKKQNTTDSTNGNMIAHKNQQTKSQDKPNLHQGQKSTIDKPKTVKPQYGRPDFKIDFNNKNNAQGCTPIEEEVIS